MDLGQLMSNKTKVKPKVVLDWDDVFWSSGYKVADMLGIEHERWIDHHTNENTLLSMMERETIEQLFMAADTYRDMQLFPGLEEVLELWSMNADLFINSNCYSEEVLKTKRVQIRKALPMLDDEHLQLNLVLPNTKARKPIDEDVDIFVDDSPYNVAKSLAKINMVPRLPWNTTGKATEVMQGKNVRYVPSCDLAALATEIKQLLNEF